MPPPAPQEAFSVCSDPWDLNIEDESQEAGRTRALLLEIVRRAAYDWVLYRTSSRMWKRELANDAYTWLFEEKSGHPWNEERIKENKQITGFLNICESLDIDPDYVRKYIKKMTPRSIKMAGRPAEHRRREPGYDAEHYLEHHVVNDGAMSCLYG